ncbi:hypothetical protein INT48_000387 [Thamnidium elegans]|uniref:Coatomer subunit beta' n=1 Tax=Thamnidium elegans TaxID=101142 RepID=A0A8H7SMN1_9FUNG|nr:hypothetical protein INT48_000387 [Thamnidium elegans]
MKIDVKRKLLSRSARVKSVDIHPTEPWLLSSLYSGHVNIYNYETQQIVKTFEVSESPVRAARFIARKNWFVTGSDDAQIRVFNYNTHEKVASFEGHPDYIRNLAVHPTKPLVLSCSDDMTIRLWDWEKSWKCVQVFQGHDHFVMHVAFNPKDTNTFASASLDGTIRIWSLGSNRSNFVLEGHERGVNFVDYYHGGDKPYLASCADDNTVRIWDYQNKNCVQTLNAHRQNVNFAVFHPELPIILSGSEDGTVCLWNSDTYRLENTLDYGLERSWCISCQKDGNNIALGFDEGSVVIRLGREEPVVSMDASGKIIWAKNAEIQTANVKTSVDDDIKDGDRLALPIKDLGSCEVYPQTLKHSPNGRFVSVCGDGEFIIYTALAWRNKTFGSGLECVWATDSNTYAVRESTSRVKVFKNFKERAGFLPKLSYAAEGIFGGGLLGVRSNGFLNFYDWETGVLVRRIDVECKDVIWSDAGDLIAIVCEDSFYVLRYNPAAYMTFLENGGNTGEEGVEEAFEFITEISESVKTGSWAGDCLIYTNGSNRLNYLVGSQVYTISHSDKQMYLLGYSPRDSRIYLADRDVNISSYSLSLAVIQYQTAVLRGDLEEAHSLIESIPKSQLSRIARFLESQNLKELALDITSDDDQKFDLSIQLGKLDIATEIAERSNSVVKWRTLGDRATSDFKFKLAEKCLKNSNDLNGLLLFYLSSGNRDGLRYVADKSIEEGKHNIAFSALMNLQAIEELLELLIKTDRLPEAALFARTYCPQKISEIVQLWKADLNGKQKTKVAESLADPASYANLFPELSVVAQTTDDLVTL